MAIALDYTSRIDPASLKAAGVSTVCRYLSWLHWWNGQQHSTFNPKIIGKVEYDELVRAGVTVVLNWEYSAEDWLGGATAGKAHAVEAVAQAKALGHPAGWPIVGSADFNMTRDQWNSHGYAYASNFEATIRAGGYLPGVYGPYDVLTWCRDETGIEWFWQAGMSTSWSEKRNAKPWPGAHLRQRGSKTVGGVDTDWNDILIPDWGQHGGDGMAGEADKAFGEVYGPSSTWVNPTSWMAKAVEQPLAEVRTAVGQLATAGVDLDALAAKVAALAPKPPTAAEVAAEIIKQLGNG